MSEETSESRRKFLSGLAMAGAAVGVAACVAPTTEDDEGIAAQVEALASTGNVLRVTRMNTIVGDPGLRTQVGDTGTKQVAILRCHTTASDGGGGVFYWIPTTGVPPVGTDDGGTRIVPAGASGYWQRIYSGPLNVRWFGAQGDGVTDDTAAINAALSVASSGDGGAVYAGRGTYRTTAPLTLPNRVRFFGDGYSSHIKVEHLGHGVKNLCPINTSTASRARIERLRIQFNSALGTSQGAGIAQVCGTFFVASDCVVDRFKWGIVLDQSELTDVDLCDFEGCWQAGVWIVNGDDFSPGASAGYTNHISVSRCQFNEGAYGILNDGGGSHVLSKNSFNGQTQAAARIAGANNCMFVGNYVEGNSPAIISTHLSLSGSPGPSQNTNLEIGNNLMSTSGQPCVVLYNGSPTSIRDNLFATGAPIAVVGVQNCYMLNASGNAGSSPTSGYRNFDTPPLHGLMQDGEWTANGPHQQGYGTSAPTTGLWYVGATVHNTTPSVGAPLYWVCIAGGTPGTWLAGPTL